MSGKAAKVTITEKQRGVLERIKKSSRTTMQRLVQRASVILMAFGGALNEEIAREVGLQRKRVGLWRKRWQESFAALVAIECRESSAALRRAIEATLADAPRSGAPGTFTAQQVTQILALACEPPSLSGRPITAWTGRELADEAQKRGIVESISLSQVNRYLAEAALQPHRSRYWLNTTEKDPQRFQEQVEAVCDGYLQAPALYYQHHTHTVCVDEMTGIQALERNAQEISMKPGQPARIEYEYTRHGTLCLIGNWHVVLGQMISPTIGPTRTEEDFCKHIQQTVATDSQASWRFVVDNLNIHASESLVRYVAGLEGIDESLLGRKEKSGILKSLASRTAFLSDRSHRIRFIYLPKHSSWLNQVEVIFGIITRRIVRRGNFTSTAALQERLQAFLDYFNRTYAKPFRWTYTGRPVAKSTDKLPTTWREKWANRSEAAAALALVAPQL